ncbi:hypothetical protein D3C86_1739330 [compost metagenome]
MLNSVIKSFIAFSAICVGLKLFGVQIVTKCIFDSKNLVKFNSFSNGFFVSEEKSEAKTILLTLKLEISFLITKTGISEFRTTFSVLEPISNSSTPEEPCDPIIIKSTS